MAVDRLVISGYGQVELNQVAFPRDGRVEARCAPAAAMENGTFVKINKVAKTVAAASAGDHPIIVYSSERDADPRKAGLKHFTNPAGAPLRAGYLDIGDQFTTNTFKYDDDEFANEAAISAAVATGLYAVVNNGILLVSASAPVGHAFVVIKAYTLPDGQYALRFMYDGVKEASQVVTSEAVPYLATGAITEVAPVTVTWDAVEGEFDVPFAVSSFTFKDGGDSMTALKAILGWEFGPSTTEVSYTVQDVVTEILPASVTWNLGSGKFVVPFGVVSFTFKDGTDEMTATKGVSDWTFAKTN